MIRKYFILASFITLLVNPLTGMSQTTAKDTVFNQTDANGLKQGNWKKYYPNGKLMYTAFFKDGKPIGEMRRYSENGNLEAVMNFNKTGEYARAKLYFNDGRIAAEGNFINSKKDSTWKYYSYYSHAVIAIENYKNGLKDGISKRFYENGSISEEQEWRNNLKDGEWKQYFQNGELRSSGIYKEGKLSGTYEVYYENGQLRAQGNYDNNIMNGNWVYYDENGKIQAQLKYINGKPENEKAQTADQQKYFEMIDQNKGKYREPDPSDLIPGAQRNNY